MAKTLGYSSGATGTGTEELIISWGKNTTRQERTQTYTISNNGKNSLVVTQQFVPLFNTPIGTTNISAYPESAPQTFTFSGKSNAKQLEIVPYAGVTATGKEMSGSNTGQAISVMQYADIENFEGGRQEYEYEINATIPANPTVGNSYSVDVSARDDSSSTPISTSFMITISDTACTGMTISEPDWVSPNIAEFTVGFVPANTTQNGFSVTAESPGSGDISSLLSVTKSDNKIIAKIIDPSVYNLVVNITATNTGFIPGTQDHVSATKETQFTYYPGMTVDTDWVNKLAADTSDNQPIVTLSAGLSPSDIGINVSGIISTARLVATQTSDEYRLSTTFPTNDTMEYKTGAVTLSYPVSNPTIVKTVNYGQARKPNESLDINIIIHDYSVRARENDYIATALVDFINNESGTFVFKGLGVWINAFDSNSHLLFKAHNAIQQEPEVPAYGTYPDFPVSVSFNLPQDVQYSDISYFTLVVHNGTSQNLVSNEAIIWVTPEPFDPDL